MSVRGDQYDSGHERRAALGENVHGEADFVMEWAPRSVLDAGCGTGRVGRELSRRGLDVVGFDADEEMLETARRKAPEVEWRVADAADVDLGRQFEVVLMAGNVINFVPPEHRQAAILNMARHVDGGGLLICGHSVRPDGCAPGQLDEWATEAGLELVERWATWQRARFDAASDYSLSIHRKGS